jgi:hypothetical protein
VKLLTESRGSGRRLALLAGAMTFAMLAVDRFRGSRPCPPRHLQIHRPCERRIDQISDRERPLCFFAPITLPAAAESAMRSQL